MDIYEKIQDKEGLIKCIKTFWGVVNDVVYINCETGKWTAYFDISKEKAKEIRQTIIDKEQQNNIIIIRPSGLMNCREETIETVLKDLLRIDI